ncbi:MAG: hypothetical protein D6708_13645 [Candidatus Dadabacteria bacterium]|nr:MAG: hypothetical protein D6708_13645 [Candidatus Dadabacteria bacterium]
MTRRTAEPDGMFGRLQARLDVRLAAAGHRDVGVRVETAPERWPGIACLGPVPARFVLRARVGEAEGFCVSPLAVRYEGPLGDLARRPAEVPAERARLLAAINAYLAWRRELVVAPRLCSVAGTAACAAQFAERYGPGGGPPCACLVGTHSCLYEALSTVRPLICLGERSALTDLPEAVGRCRTVLVGAGGLVQGVWDRVGPRLAPGTRVVAYGVGIAGAARLLGWEHHCPEA